MCHFPRAERDLLAWAALSSWLLDLMTERSICKSGAVTIAQGCSCWSINMKEQQRYIYMLNSAESLKLRFLGK